MRVLRAPATVVIVTALAWVVLSVAWPRTPVRINVRWKADVGAAERTGLEREFQLLGAEQREGTTWSYRLADDSTANIKALIENARVDDTAHLNRVWYRPEFAQDRTRKILVYSVPAGFVAAVLFLVGAPRSARINWSSLPWSAVKAAMPRPRDTSSFMLIAVMCAAMTAAFRFLATTGFSNDHFVHLTAAQQMLFGDWPTRDFIDVGRPLQILLSAAMQALVDRSFFAEALLVSIAFGVAAAFTAAVVLDLTASPLIAIVAVMFEVAAFPRSYAYPKLLATAVGLWLIGRYLRRPSLLRQAAMAAGAAVAFLFRHDLGLFIGVGGIAASWLADLVAPRTRRARAVVRFAALTLLMVLPYLIYVQANGGLWNYAITARDASRGEAGYVWPNPFTAGVLSVYRLVYAFHLLPLAVIAVVATSWRRAGDDWRMRFALASACVAVAENFGLIRDLLDARLPDAIVPVVILGAWLAHRVVRDRRPAVKAVAAVVFVWAAILVGELGSVPENLDRAGLTEAASLKPSSLALRFRERSAALHGRFSSNMPSRAAIALMPFFRYLDRCTTERDRLFLGGMIPEVAYLARRPFAGGGYEHYNFNSEINQHQVVDRLRRQKVPFAIIPTGPYRGLDDLPILARYIHARYVPLTALPVIGDEGIQILVDSSLTPASRDAETGWPCFR